MKRSPSKNYQSSVSIKLNNINESMEKIKNGCPEYVKSQYPQFFHPLYRALHTMRINKLSALPQCR